jgi:hypothetical protein
MTRSSPAYPSSPTASLAYRYNPPHTFEERRAAYFRSRLASALKADLLRRLPLELVSMVADCLVREYAIVYAREALRHAANPLQPAVADIDLTRDVYATYVRIEDAVYFQSLHNAPPPGGGSNRGPRPRRVFEARSDGELVRSVYFAFDHLGVRAVCFDALPSAASVSWLSNIGEVWWLEVARRGGLEKLGVDFDVSGGPPYWASFSKLEIAYVLPPFCFLIGPQDQTVPRLPAHAPEPSRRRRALRLAQSRRSLRPR